MTVPSFLFPQSPVTHGFMQNFQSEAGLPLKFAVIAASFRNTHQTQVLVGWSRHLHFLMCLISSLVNHCLFREVFFFCLFLFFGKHRRFKDNKWNEMKWSIGTASFFTMSFCMELFDPVLLLWPVLLRPGARRYIYISEKKAFNINN